MYAGDSLFTLTPPQIAGVLLLGAALWTACLAAVRAVGPRGLRVAVALALAWTFEWLSPQAFYGHYRAIFDGLPAQWVAAWPPPGPGHMARLMAFRLDPSLSAHGRALLAWSLLLAAALPARRGGA